MDAARSLDARAGGRRHILAARLRRTQPCHRSGSFHGHQRIPQAGRAGRRPVGGFLEGGCTARWRKVEAGGLTRRLRCRSRHFGRKALALVEKPYGSQRFRPRAKVAINAKHSGAYEARPPCWLRCVGHSHLGTSSCQMRSFEKRRTRVGISSRAGSDEAAHLYNWTSLTAARAVPRGGRI